MEKFKVFTFDSNTTAKMNGCRKRLFSPKKVGAVMDEIWKLKPDTIYSWWNYYKNNIRNEDYLHSIALELSDATGVQEKYCYRYILNRVIINTWNGYCAEQVMTKHVMERYPDSYYSERATKEQDREYAIDFIIYNHEGSMIGAIQVKPITYLRYSPHIARDRRLHQRGNSEFEEKYGVPVHYVFYNNNLEKCLELNYKNIEENVGKSF